MMVKVCGITRREDAEAAVNAGATALGFIFYSKSPRYVAPEKAAALARGLPVWKVGVFVSEAAGSIEAIVRAAQLDVVQVYDQVYDGDMPSGVRVWKAFRLAPGLVAPVDTHVAPVANGAEAILLDGPANGISFDWAAARSAGEKVIVAGGLDASNVAEAIRIAKPWGVDASSRLESSPGIKDKDKVRQFVEAALKA